MRLEGEQVDAKTSENVRQAQADSSERIEQLRKRQEELQKVIVSRGEKSADLTIRDQELEQLEQIADGMTMKLERLDIEASSPDRIRQVQKAVISPER